MHTLTIHHEPPRATSHHEPRATTSHGPPRATGHHEPQSTTSNGPPRATTSRGPPRATGHHEPRATTSHEPRATTSQNSPVVRTHEARSWARGGPRLVVGRGSRCAFLCVENAVKNQKAPTGFFFYLPPQPKFMSRCGHHPPSTQICVSLGASALPPIIVSRCRELPPGSPARRHGGGGGLQDASKTPWAILHSCNIAGNGAAATSQKTVPKCSKSTLAHRNRVSSYQGLTNSWKKASITPRPHFTADYV